MNEIRLHTWRNNDLKELPECVKKSKATDYREALRSRHWEKLKLAAIERSGNRCEECGVSGNQTRLQLHHRHYRTLGRETLADVLLLCNRKRERCHEHADKYRTFQSKQIAYWRHFENWAAAFYGRDWKRWIPESEALEKFYHWKEKGA